MSDNDDLSRFVREDVSEAEVRELKEAFDLFATDGRDVIDAKELRASMSELGYDRRNPVVFQLVQQLQEKGDAQVDFAEFLELMTARVHGSESRDDVMKIFDLFDRQQSGRISFEDLKRVSQELGESLSDEELREMIDRADMDDQGYVSRDDFYAVMTKKTF